MAQPNVAREPSMEEILASIRRIIESNEPEATTNELARLAALEEPLADGAGVDAEDDDIHLTIDDELPAMTAAAEAAAQPPITQQNQPVARPQPVPQPRPIQAQQPVPPVAANTAAPQPAAAPAPRREEESRSISLADVAARVRAASERLPMDPLRTMPQPQAQPQPETPAEPQPEMRNEPSRPVEAARPVEPARPVELRPAQAEPVIRQIVAIETPASQPEPIRQPEPVAAQRPLSPAEGSAMGVLAELSELAAVDLIEEPVRHEPPVFHTPAEPAAPDLSKALVSQETGEQVARSFHELAAMVNMTATRSLDEIAEDMLRPMLQEWLDDNLPTLVERLVREEIERVARGPRR